MQLPGAKTPVSPKVISGANWSGYATLILTLLGYITPDMLGFLGHFAPLAYGLVVGASYAIGAYRKADPARDAGFAALAAQLAQAAQTATTVVNHVHLSAEPAVPEPAAPAIQAPAPSDPPADAPAPAAS